MSDADVLDWRRRIVRLYAEVLTFEDPHLGHEHWRVARDELLCHHPASPVPVATRSSFHGVRVAPYDPRLRFLVHLERAEPARLEVPTGTDGVVRLRRIGAVRLPDIGVIDVWWLDQYGGGLFLPLRDGLAGSETFGGGRYLLDTAKGADLGSIGAALVVDLNFAYNPSCAYDPAWACPLAPPGNTVSAEVRGGELSTPT